MPLDMNLKRDTNKREAKQGIRQGQGTPNEPEMDAWQS
ncbi:Uncharacterized protein dnl_34110 [Desulfonema limicola]|uniref:Uncharacterized protein n=1 Tax=Desulfonema limicola TaxID=45656 RepID=A0A975B702_9BACT|nr:Uncharacterized protein dnl_22660 [Desulfonema limicola]QTA81085.1 Uncharacterized protein dnl_34110 [Desulfonema limicola]